MTLSVAIPDASLIDCSDLREKTVKAGLIARALAVFRVEFVYIYDTGLLSPEKKRDADLLRKILQYMDTPQYLRKRSFSKSQSLKYAGLLPPLRTKSHPLETTIDDLQEGIVRWGLQVWPGKIDLGLSKLVGYSKTVSERDPTLFKVIKTKPQIVLEMIDRDDVLDYWGFAVERVGNLVKFLEEFDDSTRIGFSRNAPSYLQLENDLKSTIAGTQSVLALFGGPSHGILEFFKKERDAVKSNIDFWVNTIPDQGTETVRLEEAMFASLSLLNTSVGMMISKRGFHE
jgi:predicted SPOUT superfamily RNA methylase MTH1